MVRAGDLWSEFRAFALKGNLIDLAVAVVIGGAFGAVVNSLVKNILMPLLSYVTQNTGGYHAWKLGRVEIGTFLGEVVNFGIVALAMFVLVVKVLGGLQKAAKLAKDEAPTTRECPYCMSEVPIRAVKCAHCISDLPAVDPHGAGVPTGADRI